jgi:hypothetical protein
VNFRRRLPVRLTKRRRSFVRLRTLRRCRLDLPIR